MKRFYLKVKNWLRKHVRAGSALWHLLVFPQRFRRHGFRIFKGYWEARETKAMVRPLKTREFLKDHVSIVINSAGRLEHLQKTIEALRKYFDYDSAKTHWLIIDDYPDSKETRDYIKTLDWFDCVILNERNRGLGYSINKIFSNVQTEFVFYCQEDCELLRLVPIEKMIQILRGNPHLRQLKLSRTKPYIGAQPTTKEYHEDESIFTFHPYLASMNFFLKVLPFPFYFTAIDFNFKIRKKGWRVSGVLGENDPSPYVLHRDLSDKRMVWVVK